MPSYAQEQLVNHLEYDTMMKNVIKEINNIRNIACENESWNMGMRCENCPFYSSVHGCRFDYINDELECIYRK